MSIEINITSHRLTFSEGEGKGFFDTLLKEMEYYAEHVRPIEGVIDIKYHDYKKSSVDWKHLPRYLSNLVESLDVIEDEYDDEEDGYVKYMAHPMEFDDDEEDDSWHVSEPAAIAPRHPNSSELQSYINMFMKEAERSHDYTFLYKIQSILFRVNKDCNYYFDGFVKEINSELMELDEIEKYKRGELKSSNLSLEKENKVGRKKEILFATDNNYTIKDLDRTLLQAKNFMAFLKKNGWDELMTSSSKNSPLNMAIFAFVRYWKNHGDLRASRIVSANAIYRFMTEDCPIKIDATMKSFNNVFRKEEDMENQEMDKKVESFFNNLPNYIG